MVQQCKHAALRAYRELRACGRTEKAAFDAAVAVYLYHHPETAPIASGHIVAGWLDEGRITELSFGVEGTA